MKIGMFTAGYHRNPLEHAFQDAQRFGYDYIELWGGRPHAYAFDLKSGDINIVRSIIEKYNMPVLGYTPEHNAYPFNFMNGNDAMRDDSINYLLLSLEMSKEMGADFMLVGPGHAGYDTPRKEIQKRLYYTLDRLVKMAEKLDVKIVLEAMTTFETNTCTCADDLVEVIEHYNSSCLVAMCDIVPPFVIHESIMSYFTKLQDKMHHLHIIDSNGKNEAHLVPGEGIIPMKELVYELKQINYNKTATIELVASYLNEPRLYSKRAIDNFKQLMR